MPIEVADLTSFFHSTCLKLNGHGLPSDSLTQALVCGAQIESQEFHHLLKNSGLLHLFVVSGAHLIFLDRILEKVLFLRSAKLRMIFLAGYALACNLQPPVVRALFSVTFGRINASQKLNWSPLLLTVFTSAICLLFAPHWWKSYSFVMSTMAALVLALRLSTHWLKQSLLFYVLFLPFTLSFGPAHPIAVLASPVAGLMIAFVLFPLALVCLIFPFAAPLLDWFWRGFSGLLNFMLADLNGLDPLPIPILSLWVLVVALCAFGNPKSRATS